MKTYEDFMEDYKTGREYTRADMGEVLSTLGRYHRTMGQFIEQFERVFMIAGEVCGYDAKDLCATCQEKK